MPVIHPGNAKPINLVPEWRQSDKYSQKGVLNIGSKTACYTETASYL
jgi:hypothetical protein